MKANELKSYRKEKKLTQAQLANWLGCSLHSVVSWENQRNPVPLWVATRITSERPAINPVLTLEQFQRAQAAAAKHGMPLEAWLGELIKNAL